MATISNMSSQFPLYPKYGATNHDKNLQKGKKGPYKSFEDEAFKFCITSSHRWMPSDTLVTVVLLASALLLVTFWKPEKKMYPVKTVLSVVKVPDICITSVYNTWTQFQAMIS